MKSAKSPWRQLAEHPPALVRLLARRRLKGKIVQAMTLQEIAIIAGIPLVRVTAIARQVDWEGITIPEAQRFVSACNFDPLSSTDRNRKTAYNRSCRNRKKFGYLKKHPLWETEFKPLISLLQFRKAS